MARLTSLLIFCVLLINIHAHINDAQHNKKERNHNHQNHIKTRHAHVHGSARHLHQTRNVQNRDNNENRTPTCGRGGGWGGGGWGGGGGDQELTFTFNSSSNIAGVYDSSTHNRFVIDIRSHLLLLFNGETAIGVDYQEGTGVFDRNSTLKLDWSSLTNGPSLRELYDEIKKSGTSFNVSSIPEDVSKRLSPFLRSFGYSNFTSFTQGVASSAEILSNFSSIFTNTNFSFSGGLPSLWGRLRGLRDLLQQVNGTGNFNLNLASVFSQPNGLRAFINVIEQLSPRLGAAGLSRLFNSDNLLSIINGLGGNDGFDSVWRLITQLSGNSSDASSIIQTLLQIYGNSRNISSLGQSWSSEIQNVSQQIGSNSNFSDFLPLLRNLSGGGTVGGRFNVSDFIQILQNPDSRGPIYDIVRFLTSLQNRFSLRDSIPAFWQQLISIFTSPNAFSQFSNLIPNFNITESQFGPIRESILRIIKDEARLLRDGQRTAQDFIKLFRQIPIVGLMWIPCAEAVSFFAGAYASFLELISSESGQKAIRDGLQSFVNGITGGGLGGGAQGGFGGFIGQFQHAFQNLTSGFSNSTGGSGGGGFGQILGQAANSGGIPFLPSDKKAHAHGHKERRHHSRSHEKKHEAHHN